MSDHRQGRSSEAGNRDGEDGRRVARIRSRQENFWDVPEDGARRRVHRRSRAGGRRRGRT
jgi:hypothetical protein